MDLRLKEYMINNSLTIKVQERVNEKVNLQPIAVERIKRKRTEQTTIPKYRIQRIDKLLSKEFLQ
jgi:hypothetical protein